MNSRRLYAPVVLATLAAGGAAFFAVSRTWAHTTVQADGLPPDPIDITGSSAQPVVAALALVAVTAALAVLASSPRVRRVVGVFTVLTALAGIVLVLTVGSSLDDALQKAVASSPAFTGSNAPGTEQHTLWAPITAVAFAATALLGGITAWFGPIWPTMGSRYEAPRSLPTITVPESDGDLWKAFDEGRDPTQ